MSRGLLAGMRVPAFLFPTSGHGQLRMEMLLAPARCLLGHLGPQLPVRPVSIPPPLAAGPPAAAWILPPLQAHL